MTWNRNRDIEFIEGSENHGRNKDQHSWQQEPMSRHQIEVMTYIPKWGRIVKLRPEIEKIKETVETEK